MEQNRLQPYVCRLSRHRRETRVRHDAAPVSDPAREQPFAGLLPDSEVIQRVEIAESPVKRTFRGVCPPSVLPEATGRTLVFRQ